MDLLEREVTDDVTVEHEEWLVILGQDVSGQGEGTRGAQRLLLVGEGDGDPEPREENILNAPTMIIMSYGNEDTHLAASTCISCSSWSAW